MDPKEERSIKWAQIALCAVALVVTVLVVL